MMIIQTLLPALVLTIVIEYGVLLLLREQSKRILASSVVINIITNLPLNLYILYIDDSIVTIILGELLVILAETLWYYMLLHILSRAIVYSCLCNVISFLMGVLIQISFVFIQNYLV